MNYKYFEETMLGMTWEEITDILANTDGYPDNLNEKTVRNYKNTLIREMAVLLFGSDAI